MRTWCTGMITNRGLEEVRASRTALITKTLVPVIGPIFGWMLKLFPGLRARLAELLPPERCFA